MTIKKKWDNFTENLGCGCLIIFLAFVAIAIIGSFFETDNNGSNEVSKTRTVSEYEKKRLEQKEKELNSNYYRQQKNEEFRKALKNNSNQNNNYSSNENIYKYEDRQEMENGYEYNYDVEGYDENGNYVTGSIDIYNKYGSGYITDENGNDIEISVEWDGYGDLYAEDDEGNTYELNVE